MNNLVKNTHCMYDERIHFSVYDTVGKMFAKKVPLKSIKLLRNG